MAARYLDPDLAAAELGESVTVTGPEARHAVGVSRLRPGERVSVGNGAGLVLEGVVTAVSGSGSNSPTGNSSTGNSSTGNSPTGNSPSFTFEVDLSAQHERPTPAVTLVQALAKGDRDELAIQAATELGVDAVIPWAAERSVSRWTGPKAAKGVERWGSIVREAAKQSLRAWVPDVHPLVSTDELARLTGPGGAAAGARLLVLDPDATEPLSALVPDERDLLVVIGPEGGIGAGELERLGGERLRLGDQVLRTSTAGPAALALLNRALGRW